MSKWTEPKPQTSRSAVILAAGLALYAVSTLVSMAVMSIGLGLLFLALAASGGLPAWLRTLRAELTLPVSRAFAILALSLAFACLLSLAAAALWPLSFYGHAPDISFLKDSFKLWYLFWPLGLVALLRVLPIEGRRLALQAWLLAFIALSALGIGQHFTGWPRAQKIPGHEPFFHAILFLGHHLSVASILIFPFFACLDFAASPMRSRALGLPRWLLMAGCLLGFTTLFFTWSRTLWISLPIGLIAWIFLAMKGKRAWIVGGALALAVAGVSQHPVIQQRFHDGIGSDTRFTLWRTNLTFLAERPLTGIGWHHTEEMSGYYLMEKSGKSDVFAGHAHNNLLDLLGGAGIFGALAWLAYCAFILAVLYAAFRKGLLIDPTGRRLEFARGLFCAWLVFQINGLTQVNFWEGKVEHQVAWMMAWALYWAGGNEV